MKGSSPFKDVVSEVNSELKEVRRPNPYKLKLKRRYIYWTIVTGSIFYLKYALPSNPFIEMIFKMY